MIYTKKNRSFIMNFILSIIILIVFIVIMGLDDTVLNIDMKNENVKTLVSILSLLLYLVAVISSYYYYKLNNYSDIIFYLIYFIMSFCLHITNQTILFNIQDEQLVLNLFFANKILMIMTIMPMNKFKKAILNKKFIFTICVIVSCLILSFLELSFYDSETLIKNNFIQILFFIGNLANIYISIVYYKKFKNTSDYLYLLLTVFLLSRCLKNFYILLFYNGNMANNTYATLALLLMYIGLILYSIGLLLISNMDISNKIKNMQDLDIFYNILDKGFEDREMYFYKYNGKVIYANRKARIRNKVDEDDMESFEKIGEMSKTKFNDIEKKIQKEILESLSRNRNWRGIIGRYEKLEMLIDIKIEKSKDYGEIYVVQIDYNEEMIKLKKEVDEKNKLFDIISEKSGDLIIITDKIQRITYVNKEVYKILGYDENEMVGFRLRKFLIANTNFNSKDKKILGELQFKCKNEKYIDVETLVTPINDEGWILICRNISYRRELEYFKEEYEKMKMHQQLKNDFFANLSHELKTPLNIFYSIIQVLDLNLNKDESDFKVIYEKYNKGLKINFYRMLKMITNLIDLTKFDSNFEQVKFNNYDIVKLCEDVSISVITYAQQKNINVIFDTEKEEHIIKCDGEFMERIMLNLLSNAIKYTPSGGEVCVNVLFNVDYVSIKVKDNGIGIPKEKLNSVFEKFVRVDRSLKRENEGSGIGLSIVKSLVDLLEGNIYIESEENLGSEFIIEIPNIKLEENAKYYDVNKEKITLELSDIYEVL